MDDSGVNVRPMGTARSATVRTVGGPSAEPVTVRPRTYNDAQEIADHFKEGQPVIINLEGVDAGVSRRIIDFASGMCYGLSGTMERVAQGVYLVKPPLHEH
jgi:cell division inhibitor SepF